jgi:argininosuccinate synthase
MKQKIILAYSGGLDTTVIVPWLKENYDCEVIAVCGDVGQACDWAGLEKKAISSGAEKLIVEDLKNEFVNDFLWPLVKSGSCYEKKYLLGTSAARPPLAKALARIALKEGASAIAHGCTGKGNDQIRLELGIKAFAPAVKIIAPWRIWNLRSREDEIAYLEARNIPIPTKKDDSYSRDDNLWHMSHEGLQLENPSLEPDWLGMLKMCKTPEQAPDKAQTIQLGFENGVPISLDGVHLNGVDLILKLNAIAGEHGIGIVDMIENRVVGMKSRGVYETPAGTVLTEAHNKLEQLCLDKKTFSFKQIVGQRFAELMYEGDWFSPLTGALNAFIDSTQTSVNGNVSIKLYKGNLTCTGVSSDSSLYDNDLASFSTGSMYNHKDAEGFINLLALPVLANNLMKMRKSIGQTQVLVAGAGQTNTVDCSHTSIIATAKASCLTANYAHVYSKEEA